MINDSDSSSVGEEEPQQKPACENDPDEDCIAPATCATEGCQR